MEVEQRLREQGEGFSLLANAATVDIDQLSDQLKSYQEKVQQVEQERSEIDQHIGEVVRRTHPTNYAGFISLRNRQP